MASVRFPSCLWLSALLVAPAWAQDPAAAYPSRAIRVIVPFPAGGAADALPRIVGERLAAKWGQPVVVENRVGASGSIGADAVWRAEPDGYTLLATPPAPLVINPSLYTKLAYDPAQLVPVSVIAAIPSVLLVNAEKIRASTLQEFVALVRDNPREVPPPVLDSFTRYLDEWDAVARSDITFRWSGQAEPEQVAYFDEWLYRMGLRIEDDAEDDAARLRPPEADKFHVLLVHALLRSLERDAPSYCAFVSDLRRRWKIARPDAI